MAATYPVALDDSFPRHYDVEGLVDLPNSPKHPVFTIGKASGSILSIRPEHGPKFIAIVDAERDEIAIRTWPNPHMFFVVPSGTLVDVRDPSKAFCLPEASAYPLHYYVTVTKAAVVLVGNDREIACYDADGRRWHITDAFCCKDPEISVAEAHVTLIAQHHGETRTELRVDLASGDRCVVRSWPIRENDDDRATDGRDR